jgi:hypothetical protein
MGLHVLGIPNLDRDSTTVTVRFEDIHLCESATDKSNQSYPISQDEYSSPQEKKPALP